MQAVQVVPATHSEERYIPREELEVRLASVDAVPVREKSTAHAQWGSLGFEIVKNAEDKSDDRGRGCSSTKALREPCSMLDGCGFEWSPSQQGSKQTQGIQVDLESDLSDDEGRKEDDERVIPDADGRGWRMRRQAADRTQSEMREADAARRKMAASYFGEEFLPPGARGRVRQLHGDEKQLYENIRPGTARCRPVQHERTWSSRSLPNTGKNGDPQGFDGAKSDYFERMRNRVFNRVFPCTEVVDLPPPSHPPQEFRDDLPDNSAVVARALADAKSSENGPRKAEREVGSQWHLRRMLAHGEYDSTEHVSGHAPDVKHSD